MKVASLVSHQGAMGCFEADLLWRKGRQYFFRRYFDAFLTNDLTQDLFTYITPGGDTGLIPSTLVALVYSY
jgi:hypothetical protein